MADTRKHRSEGRPNQTSATLDRRRADVTTSKPAARRKAASFGSRTATGVGRRRLSSTDHAGPTAETLAKLRPDPIVLLALRGDLGREHRVAVQEIRQAVAVVTQPVALRVSNPLRVAGPTHPLERESERNARLKRRYLSGSTNSVAGNSDLADVRRGDRRIVVSTERSWAPQAGGNGASVARERIGCLLRIVRLADERRQDELNVLIAASLTIDQPNFPILTTRNFVASTAKHPRIPDWWIAPQRNKTFGQFDPARRERLT